MVALQTMKSINQNLSKTQSEIATGKSVASARDNAAVWAISKVMESDVTGFKGISDSLALGSSTVAVAQTAAESVESALSKIKDKIISAQDPNVDRTKIQTEIADLRSFKILGSISDNYATQMHSGMPVIVRMSTRMPNPSAPSSRKITLK